MNTLGTNFNSAKFREWFSKTDEDGSGTMSVVEMIGAICDFYNIEMPDTKSTVSSDKKFQEQSYAKSPRRGLPDNVSVNSMSFIEQISSGGEVPMRVGRPLGELTAL